MDRGWICEGERKYGVQLKRAMESEINVGEKPRNSPSRSWEITCSFNHIKPVLFPFSCSIVLKMNKLHMSNEMVA